MYLDISLPEINTSPLALTGVFLYTFAFKLYISFYLMWASYKINYLFYLLLVCVYVCTCARAHTRTRMRHGVSMEVRGQLSVVFSFYCVFQGSRFSSLSSKRS